MATARLDDRFLTAWKRIELDLSHTWTSREKGRVPDSAQLLRWAEQSHLLAPDTIDFLQGCRMARNAYAHVAFNGYCGPVTLPPTAVVERLERVCNLLHNPVLSGQVAVPATVCTADTSLAEALSVMRERDFSQLPYLERGGDGRWVLVTRDQVARWLETHVDDDGLALVDLAVSVADMASASAVGPVIPALVSTQAPVSAAVQALEAALAMPDTQPGGYAVVLVCGTDHLKRPSILAADDLPRLYDLLGR
jgi:hypothetical protein